MNCRSGDLAVVVTCPPDESRVGLIFEVVRLVHPDRPEDRHELGWTTKPPLIDSHHNCILIFSDSWLRPIRDNDNDGEDETLAWAGLPHKEHA